MGFTNEALGELLILRELWVQDLERESLVQHLVPREIHAAHSAIEYTAPYRDPIWATVTLDPDAGELRIEGVRSSWVGPSPAELDYQAGAAEQGIACSIEDRRLRLGTRR